MPQGLYIKVGKFPTPFLNNVLTPVKKEGLETLQTGRLCNATITGVCMTRYLTSELQ